MGHYPSSLVSALLWGSLSRCPACLRRGRNIFSHLLVRRRESQISAVPRRRPGVVAALPIRRGARAEFPTLSTTMRMKSTVTVKMNTGPTVPERPKMNCLPVPTSAWRTYSMMVVGNVPSLKVRYVVQVLFPSPLASPLSNPLCSFQIGIALVRPPSGAYHHLDVVDFPPAPVDPPRGSRIAFRPAHPSTLRIPTASLPTKLWSQ